MTDTVEVPKEEPKHYTMELEPGKMVLMLAPLEPPKEEKDDKSI